MIVPLIIGVAGVAVLVSLGNWQVQRLAWKEGVLADIEARIAAAPVPLPDRPDPDSHRYLPVTATGIIGAEAIRVLVSTREDGAGYRIISTFETDGRIVLVDLGFIDVEAEIPPGGPAVVIGNLHWPDEVTNSTPDPDLLRNIWFARDVPVLADTLSAEPVLIIARSIEPGRNIRPLPVGTEGIPNDHLQYAGTWFSLAFIWFGMTLYLLWRIRQRTV